MIKAKQGDKVRIDYTGTLDDGTVFDSTIAEECGDDCHDDDCGCESGPMEFVIGGGEFFSVIEEAVIGMAPGERKKVVVAAADAFGDYDAEKVFTVPRTNIPEDLDPQVGDELVLGDEEDEEIGVTVVETSAESITFDANHPLAGEDLTFDIELLEILPQ